MIDDGYFARRGSRGAPLKRTPEKSAARAAASRAVAERVARSSNLTRSVRRSSGFFLAALFLPLGLLALLGGSAVSELFGLVALLVGVAGARDYNECRRARA